MLPGGPESDVQMEINAIPAAAAAVAAVAAAAAAAAAAAECKTFAPRTFAPDLTLTLPNPQPYPKNLTLTVNSYCNRNLNPKS